MLAVIDWNENEYGIVVFIALFRFCGFVYYLTGWVANNGTCVQIVWIVHYISIFVELVRA